MDCRISTETCVSRISHTPLHTTPIGGPACRLVRLRTLEQSRFTRPCIRHPLRICILCQRTTGRMSSRPRWSSIIRRWRSIRSGPFGVGTIPKRRASPERGLSPTKRECRELCPNGTCRISSTTRCFGLMLQRSISSGCAMKPRSIDSPRTTGSPACEGGEECASSPKGRAPMPRL